MNEDPNVRVIKQLRCVDVECGAVLCEADAKTGWLEQHDLCEWDGERKEDFIPCPECGKRYSAIQIGKDGRGVHHRIIPEAKVTERTEKIE